MLPFNNNTASAAVAPPTNSAVTYAVESYYQHYENTDANGGAGQKCTAGELRGTSNCIYNPQTTVSKNSISNNYGSVSYNSATKTASFYKKMREFKTLVPQYIEYTTTITVPAFTEYTVRYTADVKMTEGGSYYSSKKLYGYMHICAYGERSFVADDYSFGYFFNSDNVIDQSNDAEYGVTRSSFKVRSALGTQNPTTQEWTGGATDSKKFENFYTQTYTNNTDKPKEFKSYFGIYCSDPTATGSFYYYEDCTAQLSEKITVTALSAPKINNSNKVSDVFDADGNTFTFTNYDKVRMEYSVKFTPTGSDTATDISVTIEDNGDCTVCKRTITIILYRY